MSITLARILFMIVCFVAFGLIWIITYRRGAKKSYDDVASQIIEDDDDPEHFQDSGHE